MDGLLKFLLKDPDARKVFGKRELKIIEKQAWGVDLTQSEKNRLSRDIRKKLEVVEKLARFSEEFKLKKGSALKNQVEQVMQTIKQDAWVKKIKRIWLFGSSVEKTRSLRSDVDVAVEFDQIEIDQAIDFRKRILGNFDRGVDVQAYNVLPEAVKAEVRKGKILYELME